MTVARGIKLRDWGLDIRDYETDDAFRAAVAEELARFEHIGERFGLALIAAPVKRRAQDDYVTVGWHFKTATIPTAGQVPAPEVDEPDPFDPTPDPEVLAALAEVLDGPDEPAAVAESAHAE